MKKSFLAWGYLNKTKTILTNLKIGKIACLKNAFILFYFILF